LILVAKPRTNSLTNGTYGTRSSPPVNGFEVKLRNNTRNANSAAQANRSSLLQENLKRLISPEEPLPSEQTYTPVTNNKLRPISLGAETVLDYATNNGFLQKRSIITKNGRLEDDKVNGNCDTGDMCSKRLPNTNVVNNNLHNNNNGSNTQTDSVELLYSSKNGT